MHQDVLLELCYQVPKRLLHHVSRVSLYQYLVPNNCQKKKRKKEENCPMRVNTKVRLFCRLGPLRGLPDGWVSHLSIWNTCYFSNSRELYASKGSPRNKSGRCLSAAQLFQLFCLSCFPRINVRRLNIVASMVRQGCVHVQRGARAALSQGGFPPLLVSVSFCLTFKLSLLTLLVKTGLYFSSLQCARLVQVVKRSKLSSFPNINTLLANNNYSTQGVFLLFADAWGVWC